MSWLLRTLRAQGHDPQVLINVTNDSWFRGSSILDHHLACEVLTAVELRRPFLIAANTGLTAWIDGSGRILQQTKRLEPAFIIAEPTIDSRFRSNASLGRPACVVHGHRRSRRYAARPETLNVYVRSWPTKKLS